MPIRRAQIPVEGLSLHVAESGDPSGQVWSRIQGFSERR
jgi:hypothetical protein